MFRNYNFRIGVIVKKVIVEIMMETEEAEKTFKKINSFMGKKLLKSFLGKKEIKGINIRLEDIVTKENNNIDSNN